MFCDGNLHVIPIKRNVHFHVRTSLCLPIKTYMLVTVTVVVGWYSNSTTSSQVIIEIMVSSHTINRCHGKIHHRQE